MTITAPCLLLRRVLIAGFAVVLVALAIGYFAFPYWQAAKCTRQIQVARGLFDPYRLKPYRSLVIRSEKELKEVIDSLKTSMEHGDYDLVQCQNFENNVRESRVDFSTESLILILPKGGSGSTNVGLARPYLQSKRLVCNIWRKSPIQTTRDWVHDCFAIVVQKDMVAVVEIWDRGEKMDTLSIERQRGE